MATPSILSSPSLHAHTYQPGSMSSSHHTRAHPSPSTSTVAQAAQVPLPGTPSTPSRRKRVEAEDELANGAGRKKRVETGGGGAAGPAAERAGQLPGVQEEAAHKLAAVGAGLVDGKRVKQLPYEYMDASEEDLVILIGTSRANVGGSARTQAQAEAELGALRPCSVHAHKAHPA